jgi:hypothetical protein
MQGVLRIDIHNPSRSTLVCQVDMNRDFRSHAELSCRCYQRAMQTNDERLAIVRPTLSPSLHCDRHLYRNTSAASRFIKHLRHRQNGNASKTDIINNGLPRSSYSYAIDGARAGQLFNDEIYGGISSEHFGTLTFGRERSLGTDAMLQYDPAGGSYAFSYIGYNGTMAGGGDTENSRWMTP